MRVTVTQLPDDLDETTWSSLARHVSTNATDLLLVGELCFSPWLAIRRDANDEKWSASVAGHDRWISRLGELGVETIAGSRPIVDTGVPHNEAYVWTADAGAQPDHRKYYLPDEPGFWEATWYRRGDGEFTTVSVAGGTAGFLLVHRDVVHRARQSVCTGWCGPAVGSKGNSWKHIGPLAGRRSDGSGDERSFLPVFKSLRLFGRHAVGCTRLDH